MEITTKDAKETYEFGKKIGSTLVGFESDKQSLSLRDKASLSLRDKASLSLRDKASFNSSVFALVGDLGSGKTTFVQGLASGLGIKQRVISPTFIIMRSYRIKVRVKKSKLKTKSNNLMYTNFYHVDLYRLKSNVENEIANLGLREVWIDSRNIVAIEWAEKVKKIIPKNAIWVNFRNYGEGIRRIVTGDKYDNLR